MVWISMYEYVQITRLLPLINIRFIKWLIHSAVVYFSSITFLEKLEFDTCL